MAGGAEPFEAQAVVRETLNYASEKGMEIGCWLQYHPLLLYLLSHSLTDRWGHLDEVSQEVSTADPGLIDTVGTLWGVSLFLLFSAPFHRIGGNVTFRPLIRRGVGGRGPAASGQDVCLMTSWWYIWASEIGQGWLWGVLHWFSGMRTISCHTYNEQWGQEVTLLTAFPLPKKKINSLLELHRYQRWNGIALRWRQRTFTYVRYDYRCSLVSLLLLWRNFSGSVPLSLAGPVLFLLLIWTSCSLSLDSSLPGCWFYFCPLLQAIHSAYCACTDETHIWNTCFLHTVKYYIKL